LSGAASVARRLGRQPDDAADECRRQAGRLACKRSSGLLAPNSGSKNGEHDPVQDDNRESYHDDESGHGPNVRQSGGQHDFVAGRIQDVPTSVMSSWTSLGHGHMYAE